MTHSVLLAFSVDDWVKQKNVYSLPFNSPSEEVIKVFEKLECLQRTIFVDILGTVLSNESWRQACLRINMTGIGVRRASDQIKPAYICSYCSLLHWWNV